MTGGLLSARGAGPGPMSVPSANPRRSIRGSIIAMSQSFFSWPLRTHILALTLIASGTCDVLLIKLLDTTQSQGVNGQTHAFEHPDFQVFMLFVSQALSLPLYTCSLARKPSPSKSVHPNNGHVSTSSTFSSTTCLGTVPVQWYLALATCHLVSSAFLMTGLVLMYASVAQMLRASAILFTASMSVVLFRTRFTLAHWCGMFFVTSGLTLVGWDATQTASHLTGNRAPLAGIACVLMAEATGAGGLIAQQAMYRRWSGLSPLQVAGWEGFLGLLMCVALMGVGCVWFPDTVLTNITDIVLQLQHSTRACLIVIAGTFSVTAYKWAGTAIIQALSAPHLTVLNCVRTLAIWTFSVSIGWQRFRWMQLGGFTILVLGTFLFNGVIELPCVPVGAPRGHRRLSSLAHVYPSDSIYTDADESDHEGEEEEEEDVDVDGDVDVEATEASPLVKQYQATTVAATSYDSIQ